MECVPHRTVAAAFNWISWYTNTLIAFDDLVESVKPVAFLKNFPMCLQRYESYLLSIRSFSARDHLLKQLMGIKTTYGINQPFKVERLENWRPTWSPSEAHLLSSLVCGYRLLDVMALVHGCNTPAPVVPRTLLQDNEEIFDGMEHLHNWPALLLKFRKSFIRSEARAAQSSSSKSEPTLRLMRLLSRNLARSATNSVEGNFIVSAMHMAYLTTARTTEGTVPDLPDSYDGLASALSNEGPSLLDASDSDDAIRIKEMVQVVKDAQKASGSNSLVGLRGPLHLGLLVSPLIFASPYTLAKRSYNRSHVLTVMHRLGNSKSELLRRVESIMWQGVIFLVNGEKEPFEMLTWLMDTLPWSDIEGASLDEHETNWFNLTRSLTVLEESPSLPLLESPHDAAFETVSPEYVSPSSPAILDEPPLPSPLREDSPSFETRGAPSTTLGKEDEEDDSNIKDASKTSDDTDKANGKRTTTHEEGSSSSGDEDDNEEGSSSAGDEDDKMEQAAPSRTPPKRVLRPLSAPAQAVQRQQTSKKRRRKPAASSPCPDSESGDLEDPFDVDLYASLWEPSSSAHYFPPCDLPKLDPDQPSLLKSPISFTGYDAKGEKHIFTPSFHHADYHLRFQSLYQRIEATCLNEKPLFLTNPSESAIEIVTYDQYATMSSTEFKSLLRKKNVVVSGYPVPDIDFDEKGLQTLSSMHLPVSLQDFSAAPEGGERSFPKNVVGSVAELLDAVKSGNRILNGLEFPMQDAPLDHTAYTSDLAAWRATSGVHTCPRYSEYPKGSMRWGLAGSANALTFMHIDSDGYNSFVKVLCGKKLWAFYRDEPPNRLSSIDVFTNPNFSLDEVLPQSSYGIEAIILNPGDLLFIKASTPHFVLTIEPAIVHGGHFYMTDLMQDTLQGLVHSFMLNSFITNTVHFSSRAILRRMLMFCYMGVIENVIHTSDPFRHHLPDMNTMDGILDLLSLAALNFLGNVLDFRTYSAPNQGEDQEASDEQKKLLGKFDRCDITGDERSAMCYARGVAIIIFNWIRNHCTLILAGQSDPIDDLPSQYMCKLLRAILRYKHCAMEKELSGAPHCSYEDLLKQIENVIQCDKHIFSCWKAWDKSFVPPLCYLKFPSPGYSVTWSVDAFNGFEYPDQVINKMGTSGFDEKWRSGEEYRLLREVRPLKKLKSGD